MMEEELPIIVLNLSKQLNVSLNEKYCISQDKKTIYLVILICVSVKYL